MFDLKNQHEEHWSYAVKTTLAELIWFDHGQASGHAAAPAAPILPTAWFRAIITDVSWLKVRSSHSKFKVTRMYATIKLRTPPRKCFETFWRLLHEYCSSASPLRPQQSEIYPYQTQTWLYLSQHYKYWFKVACDRLNSSSLPIAWSFGIKSREWY